MEMSAPHLGRYVRLVALISLTLGLTDAMRLLGVSLGPVSPIATLGPTGFTLLGLFCLARLFAAVGLWIKASWGAVLLVSATALELSLYLAGNPDIVMTGIGFAIRLALLVAIVVILVLAVRFRRAQAGD